MGFRVGESPRPGASQKAPGIYGLHVITNMRVPCFLIRAYLDPKCMSRIAFWRFWAQLFCILLGSRQFQILQIYLSMTPPPSSTHVGRRKPSGQEAMLYVVSGSPSAAGINVGCRTKKGLGASEEKMGARAYLGTYRQARMLSRFPCEPSTLSLQDSAGVDTEHCKCYVGR